MTQKDKLMRAKLLAMQMKNIAHDLRSEARDYDVRFPMQYAARLESAAEEFLKLK